MITRETNTPQPPQPITLTFTDEDVLVLRELGHWYYSIPEALGSQSLITPGVTVEMVGQFLQRLVHVV